MEPVFTSACHWALSWASSIQPTPSHTVSSLSILISFSYSCSSYPSNLFPSGFTDETLHAFLISSMRSTCPAHPLFLNFIALIIFGEVYRLWNSSLCYFFHPPDTFYLRSKYSPQHFVRKHQWSVRFDVVTAVKKSMSFFWVVTCHLHLQRWRWRQYVPLKFWYLPTSSHRVKTQKTNIDP
jgi:hypothetical protein